MIKKHKLCKVCAVLDDKLTQRIYGSAYFMKGSGEPLKRIAEDYDTFNYDNLRNHVTKHQFLSEEDLSKRHLNHIAKQAEKKILRQTIESKQVWDDVISQGMEKLEDGTLQMRTSDLLKAAKDKSDYEFKVKDQQMAMMEMVYHFASGESTDSEKYDRRIIQGTTVTHHDPTEGTTGNPSGGADQSGGVHYPPAWDAAAPGTAEVPGGGEEWTV